MLYLNVPVPSDAAECGGKDQVPTVTGVRSVVPRPSQWKEVPHQFWGNQCPVSSKLTCFGGFVAFLGSEWPVKQLHLTLLFIWENCEEMQQSRMWLLCSKNIMTWWYTDIEKKQVIWSKCWFWCRRFVIAIPSIRWDYYQLVITDRQMTAEDEGEVWYGGSPGVKSYPLILQPSYLQ